MLIDTMSAAFEPDQFHDDYKEKLLGLIEARAAGKEIPRIKTKAPAATNVVNLMDVLQRSLDQSKSSNGSRTKGAAKKGDEKPKSPRRKRTAA
jgi:DNA end-binding protein Ku